MKKAIAGVCCASLWLLCTPFAYGKSGLTVYGDYMQVGIPLSAAIYSAVIRDWTGEIQLAKSTAATIATTQILKYTVREGRPNQPAGESGESFPSGHTSAAFAGAAYWQMRYGWAIGAPMYAAASLVGYSRVNAKEHYWHDVIAGAVIGIGFNLLFTSRYHDDRAQLSVTPVPGGACLNFGFEF